MRGCVLALHRGPVNVSVVWGRTFCRSPCVMRPRRAVRCVAMVWCCVALCWCEECRRPLAWLCALRAASGARWAAAAVRSSGRGIYVLSR